MDEPDSTEPPPMRIFLRRMDNLDRIDIYCATTIHRRAWAALLIGQTMGASMIMRVQPLVTDPDPGRRWRKGAQNSTERMLRLHPFPAHPNAAVHVDALTQPHRNPMKQQKTHRGCATELRF